MTKISELFFKSGIEDVISGGYDDACSLDHRFGTEVIFPDCLSSTDIITEAAFDAMIRVLDYDVGDGLGVGFINGLSYPDTCIKAVVHFHGTDIDTVPTAVAEIFINISWILLYRDEEMTFLPFNLFHLAAGMDNYIRVAANIEHFWREDAHRTVIGWKGLVKLGHMPAQGGFTLDDMHSDPMVGEIESSLNPGYSPSYNDNAPPQR